MGFRPKDVDEMTLWEFSCCLYAEKKSSGGGDISEDRLRQLGVEGF